MSNKQCADCKIFKSISEFGNHRQKYKDRVYVYLNCYCRTCCAKQTAVSQKKRKDKLNEKQKKWRDKNLGKSRFYRRMNNYKARGIDPEIGETQYQLNKLKKAIENYGKQTN